jgi:hypothetical protein
MIGVHPINKREMTRNGKRAAADKGDANDRAAH